MLRECVRLLSNTQNKPDHPIELFVFLNLFSGWVMREYVCACEDEQYTYHS